MGSGMVADLTWQLPVLNIGPEGGFRLPEAELCWSLPGAQLASLTEYSKGVKRASLPPPCVPRGAGIKELHRDWAWRKGAALFLGVPKGPAVAWD